MMKTPVIKSKKDYSDGVAQPTREQQYQPSRRQMHKQLADRDKGQPAHPEIDDYGSAGKASDEEEFEYDASCRQRPNDSQQ